MLSQGDQDSPEALPDDVGRLTAHGPLTAVWSPYVASLAREWATCAGKMASHSRRLKYYWERFGRDEMAQGVWLNPSDPPIPFSEVSAGSATHTDYLISRFHFTRRRMFMIETEIREQVWRELHNEDDGHARDLPERMLEQRDPSSDEA